MLEPKELNYFDVKSPFEGLGQALDRKPLLVTAVWDAEDQGAVGLYHLKDKFGKDVYLPAGAIVLRSFLHVVTDLESAEDAGTLAVSLDDEDEADDDVVAADTTDNLSAGLYEGEMDGAVANALILQERRKLLATVAEAAITAGRALVFMEVLLSEPEPDEE